MKYLARVEALNENIEEEVTLNINDVQFTGFSFVCPYPIEVGKYYFVQLGFTILDELELDKLESDCKGLERLGSSYQYYIRGILSQHSIDAGIVILDEDGYFEDYSEYHGNNVEIKVDRISVEFL